MESMELQVIENRQGILTTNIEQLELFVTEKLKDYDVAFYSGDADSAKKDRAELNASKKVISAKRIAIMKELMKPYNDFETRCKNLEKMIDEASSKLDEVVKVKENAEKEAKRQEIEALWAEFDFPLFSVNKIFNPKWLNKTMKMIDIKKEMKEKIEQTYNDLKLIERYSQDGETLKALYLENLDIQATLARGEELEKNREKIALEKEARPEREHNEAVEQQKKALDAEMQDRAIDNEYGTVDEIEGKQEIKKPVEKEYVISITTDADTLLRLKAAMNALSIVYNIEEIEF